MQIVAELPDDPGDALRVIAGLGPALAALGHTLVTEGAGDATWDVAATPIAGGIDPAVFRPSASRTQERSALQIASSDFAVVMTRALREGCGATSLADAAARIRGRCPDVRTAIVGDGPMRDAVEQQLHVTGAEDRVRVIGDVTDDTRARWLATADLAVAHARNPAGSECAVREALACGTPVLANYAQLGVDPPHPDLHLAQGGAAELSERIARWAEDRQALTALRDACAAHPLATRTWADAARDLVEALASASA